MNTIVYFIRHAESDRSVRDGRIRPLTEKGQRDAPRLVPLFDGISIDAFLSSPFKRAIDTIQPLADSRGAAIAIDEDFRERRSDSVSAMDLWELIRRQWRDFSFTLNDGECLREVQERNIAALRCALRAYEGKTLVIGTHGVALCTMMEFYQPGLDERELEDILLRMPYILRVEFSGERFLSMEEILPT